MGGPERLLFSTIAPSVPLDTWLRLREAHATSEHNAESLREELKDAQKSYDEAAPLGVVSKLFKNQDEILIVDALKSRRDKIASELLGLDAGRVRVEHSLELIAEKFLRAAMSEDSLECLRSTPSQISEQVRVTLLKMTDEVQGVVRPHLEAQCDSLAKVKDKVTSLGNSYGC